MEQTRPKLKTNLDTNLLKLVAVVSMLLDHFGGTFFEQVPAFRWAGRLALILYDGWDAVHPRHQAVPGEIGTVCADFTTVLDSGF